MRPAANPNDARAISQSPMPLIRGLLDRIVLLCAVVLAGCVPSFIAQYRQRAGGRLEQVQADLAPFQQIADREHGGSLAALIQHHLQSPDATFHGEGAALQGMVNAAERLRALLRGLDTDLYHQCAYLLAHGDLDLARSTWSMYQPGFALTAQSVLFALVLGILLWLLFLGLWHAIAWLFRRRPGGSRPYAAGADSPPARHR
jgi:hypothetical protein